MHEQGLYNIKLKFDCLSEKNQEILLVEEAKANRS